MAFAPQARAQVGPSISHPHAVASSTPLAALFPPRLPDLPLWLRGGENSLIAYTQHTVSMPHGMARLDASVHDSSADDPGFQRS
jgi:hypothetical protein